MRPGCDPARQNSMRETPSKMTGDSDEYRQRKNQFQRMLTIYGRKPVLEALQTSTVKIHRLHLAHSNKAAAIIEDIVALAEQRGVEISYKDKASLSRISKNSKQDQGVAADLVLERLHTLDDFCKTPVPQKIARYIVLDCIHNPQNLGMIIRCAAAGGIDALFIPEQGSAALSSLVIKASAGAVFKCPIVRAATTELCISALRARGIVISILSSAAKQSLWDIQPGLQSRAFVLGNESHGVGPEISKLADEQLQVPMQNGVESLNVAVTAALIAFLPES